ncbi:MAG: DUF5107 domain-containing protein, partial [Anaerolineae bacterium]
MKRSSLPPRRRDAPDRGAAASPSLASSPAGAGGSLRRWCLLALFACLAVVLLSTRPQRTRAQAAGIRSHDWIYTAVADLRAGEIAGLVVTDLDGGELRLSPSAVTGVYTSPVVTSPFSFNAIAPYWQAAVPGGSALRVELRACAQRGGWSPWYPFDDADQPTPHGSFYPETPLLVSQGLQFQYRLTLTAATTGQSPVLEAMTVTAIDATAGPTTSQAKAASRPGQVRPQAVPQPAVISRDGWEANESLRYDDQGDLIWPLEYRPVAKIVVHHTVSVNDYEEEEATGWVRAIYYYHAVTLGWGDIGYNYLTDKYGNIYEGRYGGPDVVGGHVYGYNYGSVGVGAIGTYGNAPGSIPPTDETLAALRDLAAWEANHSYVHPLESAPFYDTVTPNLAGHRDYPPGTTSCPGDYLYAEVPALRQATWQRIVTHTDPYQADWLTWNRPPHVLLAGETYSLTMSVRNTGWFTWPKAGVTDAVRLGYHWFDEGSQPVAQPPQDEHRGPLDRDITFGHAYTFTPALFTTPITPGVYALAWDMVHEGVTWFHDANPASPLLTTTLSLTNTPPVTIAGELLDVRGSPVSGGQVALPNWLTVTASSNGAYALPRLARAAYTLTTSAEGYTSLPPAYAVDATGGDVTYPFVFASHSFTNLIANGDFEHGLDGWAQGGLAASPPAITATAHTGFGAAQLGGRPFSGSVWLSQTASLPSQILSPTLSLLYRVPLAGQDAAFQAVLASRTAAITHTLPLTAPGTAIAPWRHFWADVPAGWQGPLCLKLELSQSSSPTPTTVLVDEVWLGYQSLEPHIIYLPLALKTHTVLGRSELIANGTFEETGAWEILDATYPAGVVISYTTGVTLNTYPYADYLSTRHNETYNVDYAWLNWDAYNDASPRPAPQGYELLVVENDYLKLTFLPQLGGRLYQAIFKPTGNNELYGNSVIKPTGWGPPEQGWWLGAGGMEWGLPVEEHGYEWGVPWQAQTVNAADGITVTLRDSADPDRLRAAVSVYLPADRSYFVVRPRIENARDRPLTYKYWTYAMLAPGPANTVSPDLRFIYPAEEVTVHSTGDPALPGEGQAMSWPEYGGRDMSRLGNWRDWLGFFERPAAQGDFTAVYDPSVDEGMVRVFPSDRARGAKGFAFGWQKALPASLWTDDGSYYVEMHGGVAPTFWDSASLDAGDVYQWEETWYPVAGIG